MAITGNLSFGINIKFTIGLIKGDVSGDEMLPLKSSKIQNFTCITIQKQILPNKQNDSKFISHEENYLHH